MAYWLYNTAWRLAAPPGRWWIGRNPALRPLLARFAAPTVIAPAAPIWIHACSVGEVQAARALAPALRAAIPGAELLVSASTIAGHARATAVFTDTATVAWAPFDAPGAVRAFLDTVRPRALALIETELWPNLLRETARRGAPVVLVNGRLSEKHFRRYRRARALLRGLWPHLSAAGMQSKAHADRLAALGMPAERIRVSGNLKFDAAVTEIAPAERANLRRACGFAPEDPILVFGSTRPGDEALASACWATLRDESPSARLVIAPRHTDRAGEIRAIFGEPTLLRSELRAGRAPAGERVLIVDTHGELTAFYAVASVAVVGGSFYPGVEGHNPIEPTALGVPTVFGPHMGNFADAAATLLAARGARRAPCPEELYGVLSGLMADAAERRRMGTRARKAVLREGGAAERNAALVAETLAARGCA